MDYVYYLVFFSKILETATIFFVLTLTVCDPCGQDTGSEVSEVSSCSSVVGLNAE